MSIVSDSSFTSYGISEILGLSEDDYNCKTELRKTNSLWLGALASILSFYHYHHQY